MSAIVAPTETELAALGFAWEHHARPKQLPPATPWKSFSVIAARGWGKTRTACELVIDEVRAGRAKRIGFCSFNLDEAMRTLVYGEAGLLACSSPWERPEVIKGQVVFPNGAVATPYTPEVPDGPRGPSHDLFWCSEVAAWSQATREPFFLNIREGLRIGAGRMVVDSTPRARNPLVRFLLERAARDPRHVVVRGSTRENADNLTAGFVDELEAEYGSTARGRQELFGVFLDESEGALFKQADIDAHRRDRPTALKRRILSVDPAVTSRRGSDGTGIVDVGLGLDDQIFVLDDMSGKHTWEAWGDIVVQEYFARKCDVVILETNRGGSACVANVRAAAQKLGFRVEVVAADAVTRHVPGGTIYTKEVHARRGKDARADPVAALYQRGRVSHVRGADLEELETTMTTWVPDDSKSPDGMDALVHACFELAIAREANKPKSDVVGAARLQAMINKGPGAPRPGQPFNVAALLGNRGNERI